MAREPGSNRSFGLIAAIYLFKCVKEREKKKTGCFNDLRLSGGMLMRGGANALKSQQFSEEPSNISRGCRGLPFTPPRDNDGV